MGQFVPRIMSHLALWSACSSLFPHTRYGYLIVDPLLITGGQPQNKRVTTRICTAHQARFSSITRRAYGRRLLADPPAAAG